MVVVVVCVVVVVGVIDVVFIVDDLGVVVVVGVVPPVGLVTTGTPGLTTILPPLGHPLSSCKCPRALA